MRIINDCHIRPFFKLFLVFSLTFVMKLFNNSNNTFAKWWKERKKKNYPRLKIENHRKTFTLCLSSILYKIFLLQFFGTNKRIEHSTLKCCDLLWRTRFSVEHKTDWKPFLHFVSIGFVYSISGIDCDVSRLMLTDSVKKKKVVFKLESLLLMQCIKCAIETFLFLIFFFLMIQSINEE